MYVKVRQIVCCDTLPREFLAKSLVWAFSVSKMKVLCKPFLKGSSIPGIRAGKRVRTSLHIAPEPFGKILSSALLFLSGRTFFVLQFFIFDFLFAYMPVIPTFAS